MTQAVLKNQVTQLHVASGIKKDARETIAKRLTAVLGDSYRLMANTQILHWNVQGPLFFSIHNLTEAQYQKFFAAVDDIAERIRALGMPAPRTMAEMVNASTFGDIDGAASLSAQIGELIEFNEKLASSMRDVVGIAEKASDVKTADLMTENIGMLEQNAWMLRATIAATE